MAINLLNMLSDQIGGDVISQASKFLGENESSTKSAMGAAFPAILGSLMSKGSTTSGAKSILGMLTDGGHDGSIFSKMGGLFGGGSQTSGLMNAGSGILNILMGNKTTGVIDLIMSAAGIKKNAATSILSMAAPLVMGMLGKVVNKNKMDASGLMGLLAGQSKHVANAAPTGMADLLGFANLGGKVTETANAAANTARNTARATANTAVETAEKGGSWLKWALPALLLLGALAYFVPGMMNKAKDATVSAVDATKDAAGNVADAAGNVAGKAVDVTKDAAGAVAGAAGSAVDAAGNAAGAVADAAGEVLDAATKQARAALSGIKFAAGSVGEGFVNLLKTEKDLVGKSLAFKNLTFAVGSANIDPKSEVEAANLASVLKAYPNINIEIGGHTDNTGNAANNLKLSDARAKSVKAYLVSKGIAANRISTKGYGATSPKASNDTAEGKKANRRIEAKITKS